MKKLLFILIVCCSLKGFGQNKMKFDTIDVYQFSGSSVSSQGSDAVYRYNGIEVDAETLRKYQSKLKPLIDDNDYETLYFVNTYNLGDTLLFSTNWLDIEINRFGDYIRYYPSGNIRTKGQYLFFGDNKEAYLKEGNAGQKTGLWLYYSKKGELMRTEAWKDGSVTKIVK